MGHRVVWAFGRSIRKAKSMRVKDLIDNMSL